MKFVYFYIHIYERDQLNNPSISRFSKAVRPESMAKEATITEDIFSICYDILLIGHLSMPQITVSVVL